VPDRIHSPRIAVCGGACSPQQAAAVIAAVERFLRDHAPSADGAHQPLQSGWIQAAREEAVDRS